MLSPYDWQESMNNRVSYVQGRIEKGAPILAVSLDAGILWFTYRRTSRKLFEIYDRLGFGGLGQQSDIESIRVMAVEFAHREGYTRSEKDVTIWRAVTSISAPIKKSFNDFSYAPILAISLLAELGDTPDKDQYYVVDFDGDYYLQRNSVVLSGRKYGGLKLHDSIPAKTSVAEATKMLQKIWMEVASHNGSDEVNIDGMRPEIVLMERNANRDNVWLEIDK